MELKIYKMKVDGQNKFINYYFFIGDNVLLSLQI